MRTSGLRDRTEAALRRLPPISVAGSRFLATVAHRDVEVKELAATVAHDPLLTGRVLQLANSAAYGRARTIQSIPHAIAFVGVSTLRRYAISWTISGVLKRLPNVPHWSATKYSNHSEAVGGLADLLCEHIPVRSADGAYVAGLLHDIGKFVICAEAPDAIGLALSLREISPESITDCERQMLGIDHAEISSMAAELWRFPEDICTAIRYHHDPERDPTTGAVTLSSLLYKCDAYVNGRGLTMLSSPVDAKETLEIPGYERAVNLALERFEAVHKTSAAVLRRSNDAAAGRSVPAKSAGRL